MEDKETREIKQKVRSLVSENIDLSREISDEEVRQMIQRFMMEELQGSYYSIRQKEEIAGWVFASIRKLDILQELIEDEQISEIMINGPKHIFVEQNGKITEIDKHFDSKERLEDVIQQIVSGVNRTVNESSPIVDARLENGSRVNIVLSPPAINGPVVTIRRFPECAITMEKLIALGSISHEAADFLETAVRLGTNIFISGGTGSGKTTFLNALARYIPADERIITIEDSAELQIRGIPNLIRLETRNSTAEGCKEITIRDLIKSALRMRPDRIIVGEVRGDEAIDMLQAFNTGHDGSLSTGHANSARDMLYRLETMVLMGLDIPLPAVRRQISSGIDILVHLARMGDRSRRVVEIFEVMDMEGNEIILHPLFVRRKKAGKNEREEDKNDIPPLIRVGEVQNIYRLKGE